MLGHVDAVRQQHAATHAVHAGAAHRIEAVGHAPLQRQAREFGADAAALLRPGIAQGKANAALALGFGGRELARRAQNMPAFMNALSDLTGGSAVPVPGGVLLRDAAGRILGAVGVSGDLSDKDEAAAVAGIKAAGLVPDTGD